VTAEEMAEWDRYVEARERPDWSRWDDAHDEAVSQVPGEIGCVIDTPMSVLTLAPFAPHFDTLPRDTEKAARMVHDYEGTRA